MAAEVAAAEARTGLRSATAHFPCCCDCCVADGGDCADGDVDGDTCRAREGNRARWTDADRSGTDGDAVLRLGTPAWDCTWPTPASLVGPFHCCQFLCSPSCPEATIFFNRLGPIDYRIIYYKL